MALSIVLVALGIGAGAALYGLRPRTDSAAPDPLAASMPRVFAFLANRMKLDELYAATLGRLNSFLAALSDVLDRRLWDGAVRLLARLGQLTGSLDREADIRGLNAGFDAVSSGVRRAGRAYSGAQTGAAQGYLRALALAFVVLALIAMWGGGR